MKTWTVGGVTMQYPLIVGAGACKTPKSVLSYNRSDIPVGAVQLGSSTPGRREGNQGVLFWPQDLGSLMGGGIGLNSFGMPNDGFDAVIPQILTEYEIPILKNLAGFSVADYIEGLVRFDRLPGIAALVMNFGCFNAKDKKIVPFAYDLESLDRISCILSQLGLVKPVWFGLSPYLTHEKWEELEERYPQLDFSATPTVSHDFVDRLFDLLAQYHRYIAAVVFSNTLGNVVCRDEVGRPVTTPNDGKAGLSGPILKRINIPLLRRAQAQLPPTISRVGCGGVLRGDDAADYFEWGLVDAVCATSGPFWSSNDPQFFVDLIAESPRLQAFCMDTHQGE